MEAESFMETGSMYVMDLPRQFFMIRFESEDEYMKALTGGPWKVFGSYLMVQGWTPDFDPMKDGIITTPVWVRISSIPVNFYHKIFLMGIAKGLGKPIKVDLMTSNLERARFARICVEVNLKKPLKGSVMINGTRYYVSYEGLESICSLCGLYGHLVHTCPDKFHEREVPCNEERAIVMVPTMVAEKSNLREDRTEEGFTSVRHGGRRSENQRGKPMVGGERGKGNNNNITRDLRRRDLPDIPLSNSFGRLEEDLRSPEIQESNKENIDTVNLGNQGLRGPQDSKIVFGAHGESQSSRSSFKGNQLKLVGNNRGPEKSKGIFTKNQRPTRGLVFGPSKEDLLLSSSGKRMRIEQESMGRAGKNIVVCNLGPKENKSGQSEVSNRVESEERTVEVSSDMQETSTEVDGESRVA